MPDTAFLAQYFSISNSDDSIYKTSENLGLAGFSIAIVFGFLAFLTTIFTYCLRSNSFNHTWSLRMAISISSIFLSGASYFFVDFSDLPSYLQLNTEIPNVICTSSYYTLVVFILSIPTFYMKPPNIQCVARLNRNSRALLFSFLSAGICLAIQVIFEAVRITSFPTVSSFSESVYSVMLAQNSVGVIFCLVFTVVYGLSVRYYAPVVHNTAMQHKLVLQTVVTIVVSCLFIIIDIDILVRHFSPVDDNPDSELYHTVSGAINVGIILITCLFLFVTNHAFVIHPIFASLKYSSSDTSQSSAGNKRELTVSIQNRSGVSFFLDHTYSILRQLDEKDHIASIETELSCNYFLRTSPLHTSIALYCYNPMETATRNDRILEELLQSIYREKHPRVELKLEGSYDDD